MSLTVMTPTQPAPLRPGDLVVLEGPPIMQVVAIDGDTAWCYYWLSRKRIDRLYPVNQLERYMPGASS